MVWLCFPGMTSSLANHRCTLSDVFSTIFLFLTFLNIHIYFITLKTYDQQFTLTTKKSLHIIFKAHTVLPDNSILITANMQLETGFPSSHQLKSYVACKSRLKLVARCPVSGCWPSCYILLLALVCRFDSLYCILLLLRISDVFIQFWTDICRNVCHTRNRQSLFGDYVTDLWPGGRHA